MKTRTILFLLCIITLNVMGQTNGTITRQRNTQTMTRKTQQAQQKPTSSKSRPRVSLVDIMRNMVLVEGGTFTMGATSEQQNPDSDEKPTHRVSLSSYYIGKYEVTQALWKAVMGSNPSTFKEDNLPVDWVSWDDCQTFLHKLNAMTGKNFRLPTEAEWEYAARGGNRSRGYQYSGSNSLGDVAWQGKDCGFGAHWVGQKKTNELGIYDMSGNVSEWCQDWYGRYTNSAQTNPTGPNNGSYKVKRGGSWGGDVDSEYICRVAERSCLPPHVRTNNLGLRLALSQ